MKYLLIALLLISINVSAQYGDAYHRPNNYLIEKNQREYGEKQREQARINTNTKSSTSANTNLDNLIKANKNAVEKEKNTPEELARKKQWDTQKKLEEEVKLKRWSDE
jgi:hypothetical protein